MTDRGKSAFYRAGFPLFCFAVLWHNVRHHVKLWKFERGLDMDENMEMLQQEQKADDATAEVIAGVQGEQEQQPEKKYTDADVDRIVAKKIAAERKRLEKLFHEEQQMSDIEIRERNVLLRELKVDAHEMFAERGIPTSLAAVLNYDSKEKLIESLEAVDKAFQEALQEKVGEIFRESGYTPKKGSIFSGGSAAIQSAFKP